MLFLVHTQTLVNDFRFLSAHYYKGMLWAVCIASAMTIPSFITASFLQHKWNIEKALIYVYETDYEAKTPYIDSESVTYTLDIIQKNKESGNSIMTHTTPYITSFFNHIVLDNLTLSNNKINVLKDIFSNDTTNVNVGQNNNQPRSAVPNNRHIKLTKLTAKSNYNSEAGCWSSWVELQIKDQREDHVWQSEYKTSFVLPEGAFIANYYLYIGDRKEMGILAEKRSALWVYNNIVRSQQDPGLLYYNRGNCVAHFFH